ncbi:MAG: hypothetical protein MJ067_06540, partial [Oscillospiraceae bacterium]|nr:hypothetical protein [Oscillospiraceae bacterium]
MSACLGFDTSNYTTSCALYNSETGEIVQKKKLLPVKEGELGLRQSDAVFHHTVQLPELMTELFDGFDGRIAAVGVSVSPTCEKGSYMPCFLAGINAATAVSASTGVPLKRFSHQQGHIMAALYSSGRTELLGKKFLESYSLAYGLKENQLLPFFKYKNFFYTLSKLSRNFAPYLNIYQNINIINLNPQEIIQSQLEEKDAKEVFIKSLV